MKETKLTFFGGVGEIGGNKILVEDGDTRIFLDFGMSFAGESQYFSGYLTPRGVNGAGDYLEFELLPRLEGLYAKRMIRNTGIRYTSPSIDAVILSHPHMDHIGYVQFIDENIPVYCGECTKSIIDAMQESGRLDLGSHDYHTFRTGKMIKIGALEVEPVHVDHSVPGAYGFIIHTSNGTIIYSGDLRTHGPMAKMTFEFAEKACKSDPLVMVSEGTRVCPRESQVVHSEEKVKAESNNVVARTDKLVIAAFYSRDIDRFRTFYEIAKNTDRELVISIKLAHLLQKLKDDPALNIPDILKDKNVLFYKKRKKTGEFVETDYYTWERPLLDRAVNFDYIHKNQNKVLFNLDLVAFTELIDIKPSPGGQFIHSMSEPFSEEDVDQEVMKRWLDHFGLKFHQIHASGHCSSKSLTEIISQIKPKHLIPVHTEHPELFKRLFANIDIIILEKGAAYSLK